MTQETPAQTGRAANAALPRAESQPAPDKAAGPLRPAAIGRLLSASRMAEDYPLFFHGDPKNSAESDATPLLGLLRKALEEIEPQTVELDILKRNLWRLARHAGRLLEARPQPALFSEVFPKAREAFVTEFDASESGRRSLIAQLDALGERLPGEGWLLGLNERAPLEIYLRCERSRRREPLSRFLKEIRAVTGQLEDRLRLDYLQSTESRQPRALSASIGDAALANVDLNMLARLLPEPRGARRLDDAQRSRLRDLAGALKQFLERAPQGPDLIVVSSDLNACPPREGVFVKEASNSFEEARAQFTREAETVARLIQSLKAARRELKGQPPLPEAPTDWRNLSAEELSLITPVAVIERESSLRGELFASFSETLYSPEPVRALILRSHGGVNSKQLRSRFGGGLPSLEYLSVGHREAFVLQGTLARPVELAEGFRALVAAPRPGAAFLSVPDSQDEPDPWWQRASAELQGRARPSFRYNPELGPSWADRFDAGMNPQPEAAWPEYPAEGVDEKGAEVNAPLKFHFAAAAALAPELGEHFTALDPSEWSDRDQELADYLEEASSAGLPNTRPYLWIVRSDGAFARARISRELAFAAWDRMRYWRLLQELAGINNEHARRAAAEARDEERARFDEEKEALEAARREEIERVKAQTAGETVDRLVAALMNAPAPSGAPAFPTPADSGLEPQAPSASAPVETKPSHEAPVEAQAETVDEAGFDEPYIDSPMCTTCNECTNLNPLLFKYNANKQAYIAERSAGTFAQLVKAAEKCPSRCIHPGKPAAGDSTGTEEMIGRAAPFN